MSDGESIGEAVQGAMLAQAAEPGANGPNTAADGHTHESACLNCGTTLIGSHCHACGQAAHVHRTLAAFFHDLLHGVFHFEGKIWRTLPMLAWCPGELTRRYIDGQRARYVSPLALFLFSVFLMFAVYHQTAGEVEFKPETTVTSDGHAPLGEQAISDRLKQLQAQRTAKAAKGENTDALDGIIDGQKEALAAVRNTGTGKVSDIGAIDHAVRKFQENPSLMAYKAQSYAYKYSWALIPISVPFVWLLFPFSRRFHLYDHTVFVTYSLCFMTLLIVLVMIADAVGAAGLGIIAALIPPLHMYRQLRGAYGCSRAGALVRAIALSFFAFFALLLFLILIAAQTGG